MSTPVGSSNLDEQNSIGDTPLHFSIQAQGVGVVTDWLIRLGAKVDVDNYAGTTPLSLAVQESNAGSLFYLLKAGADLGARDDTGATPLHYLAVNLNLLPYLNDILRYPHEIDIRDNKGLTPLHWAAKNGRIQIVEVLVSHGAKVNSLSIDQKTPRALALENGNTDVANYLGKLGGE